MAYTPTVWNENDLITAEKLNNIESGIDNVLECSISNDLLQSLFNQEVNEMTAIEVTPEMQEKFLNRDISFLKLKIVSTQNPASVTSVVELRLIMKNQEEDMEIYMFTTSGLSVIGEDDLIAQVIVAENTLHIFLSSSTMIGTENFTRCYHLGEIVLTDNTFQKEIDSSTFEHLKNTTFMDFSIETFDEDGHKDSYEKYLLCRTDYYQPTGSYGTDIISFGNIKTSSDTSGNLLIKNTVAKVTEDNYTHACSIIVNFLTYTIPLSTNSTT